MADLIAGIIGAPVTPFREDNSVDLDTFARQIDFLARQGVCAIAHPMHIGESVNLTDEERMELARVLANAAAGRVPTFVHVSHAGTYLGARLAEHCGKVGTTGVVSMAPYHWRPGPDAIVEHIVTIARAGGGKLIAYNNLGATGVELTPDIITRIHEESGVLVGLKDASHHMMTFTAYCMLADELDADLAVYTGTEYLLHSVPMGGNGCFSACGEVAPKLTIDLYDSCKNFDGDRARSNQRAVRKLLDVLTKDYPAAIKYAMELFGRPVGAARKPHRTLTAADQAAIEARLSELGLFDTEPRGW